jgi:hypothetical protein
MTELTEQQKAEAAAIAKDASVWDSAAADAIAMFMLEGNDFDAAGFKQWLDGQKDQRGYLFVSAPASDLEQEAFGDGNVTARGRLARQLTPLQLRERARAWNLRDENDYRTKGKRPDDGAAANGGESKPARRDSRNPWSWKDDPNKQAEIARICKLSTKMARDLAKAANCRIDGRPL